MGDSIFFLCGVFVTYVVRAYSRFAAPGTVCVLLFKSFLFAYLFFLFVCFRCLFVYALTMFSAVPMGDHDKMAQDVYFGKRWLALDLF